MSKSEELDEIKKEIKELKIKRKNKEIEDSRYWSTLMDLEDDQCLINLELFIEETKGLFQIDPTSIQTEFIETIGNMQRYNTHVAKYRVRKNKADRHKTKIYNKLYEKCKLGGFGLELKAKHEIEVWIGKNAEFQRADSYCKNMENIILFLDSTVKQLSQKVYVLQSMLKAREYETGPTF